MHFYERDAPELSGEPGRRRHYAWADLLVQLGEMQAAAEAYELFDELESFGGEEMIVRSWAELAALYQQLGEGDRAIEAYERFIAAWEYGDAEAQVAVDRARAEVARLRGEGYEPRRR
jgi:tetratricopeptide (TPR) repeat protein